MGSARLIQQLAALNKLVLGERLQPDDLRTGLGRLAKAAAQTLQVERVSVWRLTQGRTAARCLELYELSQARHSSGVEIPVNDYPLHFQAIGNGDVIAADDALTDPRTREFRESRLFPLGVTSMLAVPMHLVGGPGGALWLEHVGPPRSWSPEETMFAMGAAALAALVIGQWEHREAEEALRAKEERLHFAFNASRVGVWDWDILNGRVTWSERVEALMGLLPGSFNGTYEGFLSCVHPADREFLTQAIAAAVNDGKDYDVEHRVVWPDGSVHWLACKGDVYRDKAGRPVRMSGTVMDVTERKRAEEALRESQEQLRQAQKMEAVGKLAGGIAHDFNNLLTVITGYSQLLLSRLDQGHPLRREIEEIKKSGDRAASLTQQLLAFSRRQVLMPKALDLNDVVSGMGGMLQRLLGEDVDLITNLDPALGAVKADPGQLEQVIMNLAVNARDAMPHGGKLTIETANVQVRETRVHGPHVMAPGRYALLAVSDSGCGMDAETQARIFEPFFTTKGTGKGTGLGLSTVYGIVKQSGGYVFVYSEPGRGATFKIYLPRIDEAIEGVPTATADPGQPSGTETVLLVEDEPGVRGFVRETLHLQGYRVLEARHGFEALVIATRHQNPIHLLLTDVVMPQMSGRELADQLVSMRKDLRILYISGYTENAVVHHGVLEPGTAFLQKPFTPDVLIRKVREVLDAPAPKAPR